MNIQSINSTYESAGYRKIQASVGQKVSVEPPVGPKEHVEISETSQMARKLREAIDGLPDVRADLVKQIQQRIEKNDYPLENKLLHALDKMIEVKLLNAA